VNRKFNVHIVQTVIDTKPDNIWGPLSQASMPKWVKEFQKACGLTVDGQWGPRTDNAFLVSRKRNLNNF
jgi:murein L,D-transpeptidase YcbB/YkuD